MITDLRTFPVGYITGLLHKLTWEFEQKCLYHHNREEVNIYMPNILLKALDYEFRHMFLSVFPSDLQKFKGYTILPGYEYGKIIIAHIRYPESNDPNMFHFVNVTESVDLEDKPKNA